MNMKENLINKIKLMMFYDMGKTLIENKEANNLVDGEELNEVNPVAAADAAATFRNLGGLTKSGEKVAKEIITSMNRGGGDAIHILQNNNLVALGAKDGGKLIKALEAGTIDAINLARVNKGILKSESAGVEILRNIVPDVVKDAAFIEKYGTIYIKKGKKGGEVATRKALADNSYTQNAIDEIMREIKLDANYGKNLTALEKRVANANATNKTLRSTNAELSRELENFKANSANMTTGEATTTIGNQVTNNFGTITKESAAETNAAVNGAKNIAPEVKATANEASTVVKEMKPSRWERWKAWSKKNPKSSKVLIFLGLSLTGWALYKMFSSNDRKDEVKKTLFASDKNYCAGDLLDTQNSQILLMEDGSPVIGVSPTGNKEYDSKKGLKFLSNNRVFTGDNTMRGTYGCKGGKIGLQSEQTGTAADMGISALTKMAQNKAINKADNVGNILNKINITWDTKSTDGGDNSGGGKTQSTIPAELKDVDGVKKFQTWLDSKHGGWHTKYGTLNDDTLKGWGKYGPNTTKAWSQYKDEYLNGSTADSTGTETPNPSAEVDVTKPSGIPGSPDMVGKSGLNLDVNRIKVTNQDVSNEIDKEVQPSNTELTDREKEILSNVKNRGMDKVYKGGTLTPEEQQWLSKYYGGVIEKIKNEKSYGQKTVIDVPKKDDTSNEPLNEENIIKKIVSKNLKSLIK